MTEALLSLILPIMSSPLYLRKNYLFIFKFIFLTSFLLTVISCKKAEENPRTYFGGKITNPKGAYVYFLKNEQVLDSAKVNTSNKFLFQLDSLRAGLYTFKHGPEFQYVFLEPKDSVLLYLNAWNFDESIIFSGKGAGKNNFLINAFLENEEIENNFKDYYTLSEPEFVQKIEESALHLAKEYEQLLETEKEDPSEAFKKLAETAVYYPAYTKKELFVLKHRDLQNSYDHPEVSAGFYDFRNKVDLNDESLFSYRAYSYYIEAFLYNQAYQKQKNDSSKNNFTLNFMEAVSENIPNKEMKNKFLASGFWASVSRNHLDQDQKEAIENYFMAHCTNSKYVAEAKQVMDQRNFLKTGDVFPALKAYNLDNQKVDVNKLVKNKNTVIYFWPKEVENQELLLESLSAYSEKFPDVLFVGIDQHKSNGDWSEFVKTKNLTRSTQYKMDKDCELTSWFAGDMARAVVVRNNGLVMNSYLLFNDRYQLEKNLLEFNK